MNSPSDTLTRYAISFRHQGLSTQEIVQRLTSANYTLSPPLPEPDLLQIAQSTEPKPLITYTAQELDSLQIPERPLILKPWLRAKDLAMIYARRGYGKSWLSYGIALSVASGAPFLTWEPPSPLNVLLIDGEMQTEDIIKRLRTLALSINTTLPNSLTILGHDFQPFGGLPNLASHEGQKLVQPLLNDNALIVLDNISTLCHGGIENDAESWEIMQTWLLSLRAQGSTILLVHHAGLSGNQRGTSKREDVLDSSISLSRPDDYSPDQGARFTITFQKARGLFGPSINPIEAKLDTDWTGSPIWTLSTLQASLENLILQLHHDGLTNTEIAKETGKHKSWIGRVIKRHSPTPIPPPESEISTA